MRILGIDPGYALLGYGVIDTDGHALSAVDYGVVETKSGEPFPERLERLFDGGSPVVEMYHPDCAVFEELFFYHNITTAISVSAGRGVAILAAQKKGLPLYEYTPMEIKLAVTANGHADKTQVQHMVKLLLNLKTVPKPDDAADALAAALCHSSMSRAATEQFRIH